MELGSKQTVLCTFPCCFGNVPDRLLGSGNASRSTGKFLLYYVKTGIFTPEEGHLLDLLQRLRDDSDYNCYIDVTQSDIEGHIEPTLALIANIKNYILNKQR